MMAWLEDHLAPGATKTTLYHTVRLLFRLYVASLLLAGTYSLFWLAEIAGLIPERLLSTIWIGIAVMGTIFLLLLITLFYTSNKR